MSVPASPSSGEHVECPWCLRKAQIDADGLLRYHEHNYGDESTGCRMSGLSPQRAQEITDAEIVHHIATGE